MLLNSKVFATILFIVISISCFDTNGQNKTLDSLRKTVENNPVQDTARVNQLNDFAYKIYPYNFQELRLYSDQALTLSQKLNYSKGEAVAYKNLALSFMLVHGDTTALGYLYKALKIIRPLKDPVNTAAILNYIGCYYATVKDHPQAIIYFKQALGELKGANKQTELAILNNTGNHYEDVHQLDTAMKYYNQMLILSKHFNDNDYIALSNYDIASVYVKQHNYAAAIAYCNKALAIGKTVAISPRATEGLYILLGDINFKLKRYANARALYEKSAAIEKELKSSENMAVLYYDFYLLDSLKGDLRSALKNRYLHDKFRDSLINLDKNRMVALYQVKFELEKHAEDNRRLTIQQAESETVIRNQRLTLGVALIAIIIICCGVIYLKKILNQVKYKNKVINQQNQLLENNNKVKDAIFSVISHDLRNPIAQVVSLLNLWSEGDMSDMEVSAFIPTIKNTSIGTLELLDNLLIWSKNQLNGFNFQPVSFDIIVLVNSVLDSMQHTIALKKLLVTNNIPADITVYADQEMIKIIIRNLVSNAVKFTPEAGSVNITGSRENGFAVIGVIDTGIGIKKEDQLKMFSFTSHTTLGTAKEKGTGLGLKICSDFITLNKGRIWMESKEHEGSKFYIAIPLSE